MTMHDCRKERLRKYFMITFIVSLGWLTALSYLMVWMITIIGKSGLHPLYYLLGVLAVLSMFTRVGVCGSVSLQNYIKDLVELVFTATPSSLRHLGYKSEGCMAHSQSIMCFKWENIPTCGLLLLVACTACRDSIMQVVFD